MAGRQYSSHLLDVYSVWVHAAGTMKGWRQLRKRIDCLPEDPQALGYTELVEWVPGGGSRRTPTQRHLAVFVDVEALTGDDAQMVETVAHEAAHVATMLLNAVGQSLDDVGHEAHAYIVGWVARWLWSAVRSGG